MLEAESYVWHRHDTNTVDNYSSGFDTKFK